MHIWKLIYGRTIINSVGKGTIMTNAVITGFQSGKFSLKIRLTFHVKHETISQINI